MTAKSKTAKPMGRIQRSWKLALEFGLGYPIGKSELEKIKVESLLGSGPSNRWGT
jgi:hypothetical protein